MKLNSWFISLKLMAFLCFLFASMQAQSERSSQTAFSALNALQASDYAWIGAKIYQNEATSHPKYLTYWGEGEDFPSFGIAHFIWFPKNVSPPFEETFPAMVQFVSQNSPPPLWLQTLRQTSEFDAPWQSKQQFDGAWSSTELTALRQWLLDTQAQQARFVALAFEQRWLKETASLSPERLQKLNVRLQQMMAFKQGLFAVIDYFNFKGLGHNAKEQYQGQSWGLISVLEAMPEENALTSVSEQQRLQQFIEAAKFTLQRRANLAPAERNETRWIAGWFKRLERYAQ